MPKQALSYSFLVLAIVVAAAVAEAPPTSVSVKLPEPYATPSANNPPKVVGWSGDRKPTVPAGFQIEAIAHLDNPRWIYILPNGDILVSQSSTDRGKSPNKITLLRDTDGDGKYEVESTFIKNLNQPLGMALLGNTLFVGVTDAVLAFPYEAGQASINSEGKKIASLPAGGYNNHWTRNILPSRDGNKLFVSVGSGSNAAEHGIENEKNRACILEMNPDGSDVRIYGDGLRNPVGMAFEPVSGALWTAVNERDDLGDDLVPDYITSVKDGGFYGWPYSYMGQHEDPRLKGQRPDLVAKAISPDVPLGSHTASLGLAFGTADKFPAKYHGGAFIGQHGSWNRSKLTGYRVAFVPFKDGKPAGEAEDFVAGFIADYDKEQVYGRPVGVTFTPDGALLVADDSGGAIWRVTADKK